MTFQRFKKCLIRWLSGKLSLFGAIANDIQADFCSRKRLSFRIPAHVSKIAIIAKHPARLRPLVFWPWPPLSCAFSETAYHVSILAYLVNLLFRYCFRVPSDKLSDAISSHVACVLKEEREKRDLSLKTLAKKSGISRQAISYVEQEVQSPSLDTLLRITSALGVDLAKIIARAQKRALKNSLPVAKLQKN